MTKELGLEFQKLEELLDDLLSNDTKEECFDLESLNNETPDNESEYKDSMSLIDYEEQDMCWEEDLSEIAWNDYCEQKNWEQLFYAEHGMTYDEYIQECDELYRTIGNKSQLDYVDISDEIELCYHEQRCQQIIDEGIMIHHCHLYDIDVDTDSIIRFIETYVESELRYNVLKFYIENY